MRSLRARPACEAVRLQAAGPWAQQASTELLASARADVDEIAEWVAVDHCRAAGQALAYLPPQVQRLRSTAAAGTLPWRTGPAGSLLAATCMLLHRLLRPSTPGTSPGPHNLQLWSWRAPVSPQRCCRWWRRSWMP